MKVNLLRHAKRSVARDFHIETEEKSREEKQGEGDAPSCAASSGIEPDEDTESPKPPVEANADEDIRSSAPVQGFESDEILAPRKRAKTNQIVQDSDEEAEGD
jgi:fanconi anemia group I protein